MRDLVLRPRAIAFRQIYEREERKRAGPAEPQIQSAGANGDTEGSYKLYEKFECEGPRTGEIKGTKYLDKDADGGFDSGDTGIAGWTIKLLDTNNNVIASTKTDSSGNCSFSGLPPGQYYVEVGSQTGYTSSGSIKSHCSKKTGYVTKVQKELVAAWLNMLNGNAHDDGDCVLEECEPACWIDQAVKLIQSKSKPSSVQSSNQSEQKSSAEILAVLKQYNCDGSLPSKYVCDTSLPEKICGCDNAKMDSSLANAWV